MAARRKQKAYKAYWMIGEQEGYKTTDEANTRVGELVDKQRKPVKMCPASEGKRCAI